MSLRQLPDLSSLRPTFEARTGIIPQALQRWDPGLRAAADDEDDSVIGIYDVIGHAWDGGFTSRRMAAALRAIGNKPVTVAINSPGGDVFDGIAMYSMLKDHPAKVTVKVMGLAASAASVIAMAADDIRIARAGFVMIHNVWTIAMGDRNDLRDLADKTEPIDEALADLYADRSGMEVSQVGKLMDRETWFGGRKAVDNGFADALLEDSKIEHDDAGQAVAAVRKVEASLRAQGMSRSEAKVLISELKSGERDAAGNGARDAAERSERDAVSITRTAALAASLTTILQEN